MDKTDRKRLNIAMALNDLMGAKPIEQITVVELCEEAGISRSTFYTYFEDIYSVGEWLWDREFRVIFDGLGSQYGYRECFRRLFERLKEIGPRLARVRPLRPKSDDKTYAYSNSTGAIIRAAERALGRPLTAEEYLHVQYSAYAEEAMTLKWLAEDMSVPPDVMAGYFAGAAPDFIIRAVGE